METTALVPRPAPARRVAYLALALLLVVTIVLEVVRHRTGYWQLGVFGIGPDLALLAGAGAGLARGQIHPRAVPLYNALHRFWAPVVLLALAIFGRRRHRVPHRRARLVLPHQLRPDGRLRSAHARWLPAPLTG